MTHYVILRQILCHVMLTLYEHHLCKSSVSIPYYIYDVYDQLGLWLRLECSLDSLSIDSAHVIYVSEGYDVAYNRRTASQPSHVVLRVTWYVKTFRNVNYVC